MLEITNVNRWMICDDDGVIDEGNEWWIKDRWEKYQAGEIDDVDWTGDLVLAEIHGRIK